MTAGERRPVVVGIPKGRTLKDAAALFQSAGYDLSAALSESRRLVHDCGDVRVLILRSQDVPTYVDYGAADVGIAGSDVLDEQRRDLYEPLDLGIGACRMIVAEPVDRPVDDRAHMHLRIASKYPNITREYLQRKGITADVIKLSGAIELGPLTGLCDRIVDITETGETLRQNGLVEIDTIMNISSRLVVNPASLKLRHRAVADLIERLASVLDREEAPA